MKEEFKDIKGYEGFYQVSNIGNVKSFQGNKVRVLKKSRGSNGYYLVTLHKNKKQKTHSVHRLVYFAFNNSDSYDTSQVIDHINNMKDDNRLENLQLISQRENATKDRFRKKTSSKYLGVYYKKQTKKWGALTQVNGVRKYLGYFKDELSAYNAYLEFTNSL